LVRDARRQNVKAPQGFTALRASAPAVFKIEAAVADENKALDLAELQSYLRGFIRERDWEQFHNPKNLAMALAGEAGELLEIFQWLTPEQASAVMADAKAAQAVRHELADVLVYCARLADVLKIDLHAAVWDKMRHNAAKYPVDRARGKATKYTDL
jgi:NTP pyrophosphatase (non-canonical NTP hydrolase)